MKKSGTTSRSGEEIHAEKNDAWSLRLAPLERFREALFERHDGRISEQRLGLRDIGLRIADVTDARGLVHGLDAGSNNAVHRGEELLERDASASCDVDHFPRRLRRLAGAQDAVHHV